MGQEYSLLSDHHLVWKLWRSEQESPLQGDFGVLNTLSEHHYPACVKSIQASTGPEHTETSKTFATRTINWFRGGPQVSASASSRPGWSSWERASLRPYGQAPVKHHTRHISPQHPESIYILRIDHISWYTCQHWSHVLLFSHNLFLCTALYLYCSLNVGVFASPLHCCCM